MKKILTALLLVFNAAGAYAQRHELFADVGIALARTSPGASVTYNYKPDKWIGLGIGVQGYSFYPTMISELKFVPAIYGDLRFYISTQKKDQFFAFVDVGKNFYKHADRYTQKGRIVYQVSQDNGTYTGFGFAYSRAIAKIRWQPYGSFKIISNSYRADAYDLVAQEKNKVTWASGTVVISFGCKF